MTDTKPPETFQVIEGEKPYRIRELNAGDTREVGAMIARVTGDPRIQNAVASGEQGVIVMAVISSLLERASHDVYLWIAKLIGEDKNVPTIKEYRKEEQKEARSENRLPAPEGEIRLNREYDIIERIDNYAPQVPLDIIQEIIERPTFERFLTSCSQLGTAAMKASERFRSPSKNGSDSPTDK
jgi:hypothetical protein